MVVARGIPVASARGFWAVAHTSPQKPPAEAGGMTRSITRDAPNCGGVQSASLHLHVAAECHPAECGSGDCARVQSPVRGNALTQRWARANTARRACNSLSCPSQCPPGGSHAAGGGLTFLAEIQRVKLAG